MGDGTPVIAGSTDWLQLQPAALGRREPTEAVPRAPGDDFPGVCPFHADCLEGMATFDDAPNLRPRLALVRKDDMAMIQHVDEATSQILGWSADEMVGRRKIAPGGPPASSTLADGSGG